VSHPEQIGFFEVVARANQALVRTATVLEIGSYDVNGSVRRVFAAAKRYVGIDLVRGPGVDVVQYGHTVSAADGSFDVVISGECLEHDEHWRETFATMCRLTRPGGLVAFTCASRGRPEHGTHRTDQRESPGTQSRGLDHYQNLGEQDFRTMPGFDQWFDRCLFWYNPVSWDLYFAGARRGPPGDHQASALLPDRAAVEALGHLMPITHRVARLPLRVMLAVLPDRLYRPAAFRYWRLLVAVMRRCGLDGLVAR
jgi:SAM-dependent methyltransferase